MFLTEFYEKQTTEYLFEIIDNCKDDEILMLIEQELTRRNKRAIKSMDTYF